MESLLAGLFDKPAGWKATVTSSLPTKGDFYEIADELPQFEIELFDQRLRKTDEA